MTHLDDELDSVEVRALARDLLDSARQDAPNRDALPRVAAALGVSLGSLATTQVAAGAVGILTPAAKVVGWVSVAKWVAGGVVLGSLAVGTATVVQHRGDANEVNPTASTFTEPPRKPIAPTTRHGSIPRAEATALLAAPNPIAPQPKPTERPSRFDLLEPAQPELEPSQREMSGPSSRTAGTPPPEPAVGALDPSPPAPADVLATEVALLDRARGELKRGSPSGALASLGSYHRRFPNGVLRAEALALTVESHLLSGNETQARAWYERLEQSFPRSYHLDRFVRLKKPVTNR